MAYNLEEQEQLDALKAWWAQYGNYIVAALVVAAIALAGYQVWRYYRNTQAIDAATLYGQLQDAVHLKDPKRVREIGRQVEDHYGSTAYAGLAALESAKAAYTMGDLAAAESQLRWAAAHAVDQAQRDVARLRLAGVLLDAKKADQALEALAKKPLDTYAALYADMRGDIFASQGKFADARAAYRAALAKLEPSSGYRQVVQIKLDALGDAK